MTRFRQILVHILVSLIALVIVFCTLLIIAYYHELGTIQTKDRPTTLAITGVTLLNLTDASFMPNTTILTTGRRILAIQPDGPMLEGATVIHASGRYALPPLADAAIFFEAPTENERAILPGEWVWEITRSLPEHRRSLTAAGVAVAQDLGGGLDTLLNTRRLLAASKLAGPQLSVAGPILTVSGGCPAGTLFPDRYKNAVRQLSTPVEAEQAVQSLAREGVNAISVCFSDFGGLFARMDPAILDTIVRVAHQHGLPVLAITSSLDDVQQALSVGADVLVGGVSLQGELLAGDLLQTMHEQGTLYVPTLNAVQARAGDNLESLATAQTNAHLAYQAGVPILAGAGMTSLDNAGGLQSEIQLLVDSGLTDLDALPRCHRPDRPLLAATRADPNPGRWAGQPDTAGGKPLG